MRLRNTLDTNSDQNRKTSHRRLEERVRSPRLDHREDGEDPSLLITWPRIGLSSHGTGILLSEQDFAKESSEKIS